jgi:hypothetical protein
MVSWMPFIRVCPAQLPVASVGVRFTQMLETLQADSWAKEYNTFYSRGKVMKVREQF